jgi:RimJ/RimL family protein N-acetyltransferase
MKFRQMTESDLAWFLGIRNQVSPMLHNPNQFTLEECINWFKELKSTYWLIESHDIAIGYFRTEKISDHKMMIGADIDPLFQGKGYGYLAYIEFIDQIVKPGGITQLELRVLKINLIAYNLYIKLGFQVIEETPIDFLMSKSLNSKRLSIS